MITKIGRIAAPLIAIATAVTAPVAAQEYEAAPTFQAGEILPAELLSGPGFEVAPEVRNDGYVNFYSVTTPDGATLEVQSTELLQIRAQELQALVLMNEITRTGVFKDAAVEAAKSPFVFAKDMVTSPGATMSGVVKGTGQFFKGIGHSLFGGGSEQEESVVGATLGTAGAKRAFAAEFQVDPYSANEPMQSRLTDLSWTAFAGGMATSVAMDAVAGAGTVGTVVTVTSFAAGMNSVIYDNPPAELKKINGDKLAAMGVAPEISSAFLEHANYSPTRKTYITGALEQMSGVEDRGIFVDSAVLCNNVPDTFLWQRAAEMMAGYHTNVAPVARVVRAGTSPLLQTESGVLLFIAPNDYLAWTEDLAREAEESGVFVADQLPGVTSKELWFSGAVSPLARQNFEAAGWVVNENTADQLRLP